jgi:hypothetical protein
MYQDFVIGPMYSFGFIEWPSYHYGALKWLVSLSLVKTVMHFTWG